MKLRLSLYSGAILSAWLFVMLWHMSQWQTQESDLAWTARLAVEKITEAALWTAAWMVFNLVHAQRSNAVLHIAIVGTACWIDEAVLSITLPWLFYAMGWPWPALAMKMVWLILICATAGLQLKVVISSLDAQQTGLWLSASTLAFALFFVHTWANENDSEAVKKLPYQANIYPSYWLSKPDADLATGLEALWNKEWAANHDRQPKNKGISGAIQQTFDR